MARKPDAGARDRILDVASQLFAEHGVHAVGLQQIIDACGCGKNLLYREFGSKDDLVVAFLERCRADWASVLRAAEASADSDPGGLLVALVREVVARAVADGFRGCPLRNAYAEFPDPDHPAHQVIVAHYTDRAELLRTLAAQASARDPKDLASRIELLIDGLNANGAVLGPQGAAPAAVTWAEEAVRGATQGRSDVIAGQVPTP
ncbi:TetR/AcrR family transcriptional regulator [Streptomyces sp. S.PB5]|uniref:TetR/AcrR family transcriptional regulator n=1 Tax=Streptomyces sp. S.PB5 TaxID=3020844 RepID=UPI0025B1F22A|nr:TetR/AcrR family transcriptional regulator [Streptomyces sp. S.PB5]MDN3027595.1 TetR/AcrR family transcriptional regulator [Streptomyces sp. S.PB5]